MKLFSRTLVLVAGVSAMMVGCGTSMRDQQVASVVKAFLEKSNGKAVITMADRTVILPLYKNACDRGEAMPRIPVPNGKGAGLGGLGGGLFGFNPEKYNSMVERIISTELVTTNSTNVVELSPNNYATSLVRPVAGGVQTAVDVFQNINWPLDAGKMVNTMAGPDLCILTEAKKRNATKVFGFDVLELGSKRAKIHFRISDVATGIVKAEGTYLANESVLYPANFVEVPDAK